MRISAAACFVRIAATVSGLMFSKRRRAIVTYIVIVVLVISILITIEIYNQQQMNIYIYKNNYRIFLDYTQYIYDKTQTANTQLHSTSQYKDRVNTYRKLGLCNNLDLFWTLLITISCILIVHTQIPVDLMLGMLMSCDE